MPTESNEENLGKLLYKDQEGIVRELCNYEFKEKEDSNDAIDEMKYAVEGMTDGEISMSLDISKESIRKLLKLYGLERITRKRFKKLLMGCGIQRNDAEVIAKQFCDEQLTYTPLAVQQVIETIMTDKRDKTYEIIASLSFELGKYQAKSEEDEQVIEEMANEIFIEYNPHFRTAEEVKDFFRNKVKKENEELKESNRKLLESEEVYEK